MRPDFVSTLSMLDTHYGGDVSRIVIDGIGPIPGDTLLEQMHHLRTQADGLRRLLLYPPHGNPEMCVNLIVPPKHPDSEAGYIIMEAMGYPPFSGSNTVCTATALLESGRIPLREGSQSFCLDCPEGLVHITAECSNARVTRVTCEGEPQFVVEQRRPVSLPDRGTVYFDLVWSGCFYAVVDAEALRLRLVPEEKNLIAAFGRALVNAANPTLELMHPRLGLVRPLAFVHFAGPIEKVSPGVRRARSVTYVHPGVVCRCPTGTGTGARLALLAARGEIEAGERLETVSLDDSTFVGTVVGRDRVGPYEAVRTSLSGRAWTLARSEVVIDFTDPTIVDAGLRDLLARR